MEKVPLGKSGAQVSRLCLGTDNFGTKAVDTKSAHRLMDHFSEAGGTFIDTANIYGIGYEGCQGGESETTIGSWLEDRQNRDQVFIATKMGAGPVPGVQSGLAAQGIIQECEKSLKRLGIETIDLFYAHIDDRKTPHEEALEAFEAFDRLVQSGKVRLIGASNYPAWRLAEARTLSQEKGWPAFCAVEQRYTYVRPKLGAAPVNAGQVEVNDELLDYCRHHGLPLVAYSILLYGAYGRSDREIPDAYVGPDSDARLAQLKKVSQETGATPHQVIIAWMLQRDLTIVPIIRGSTTEQLSENFEALQLQLTDEQLKALAEAGA